MERRDLLAFCGLAFVWPVAAAAEQKGIPVIGYLNPASSGPNARFVAAFVQGLSEGGYIEGQNLAIEYRWGENQVDRLPALAGDLVRRKVDVIAAVGPPSVQAAKNATSTIPIVFGLGSDPVKLGFVASLARPGGNLTGVSILAAELSPKLIELLFEAVPRAALMNILVNPINPNAGHIVENAQQAARAKGVQLSVLRATTENEIDAAFASLVQLHAAALVIAADPLFDSRTEQLVALAARYAVPAISPWREFATAGGLISYGPSITAAYRLGANFVVKLLNGAKPADLPVQQPTKFELVINLKTAKALGLTVPQALLARADEVIE